MQLLYYDIAWYLVTEDCETGYLAISRVDLFKNYLKILNPIGWGVEGQRKNLQAAHQLLQNGWGLNLENPSEQ